jgi:CheY-like chemotaxis protein
MRNYLVVDDNEAFADNLAEFLGDRGATVEIATGGADALRRIERTRYDAIISDMKMPVMGGAELVHRLRALDPDVPTIVITAYTNDDDLEAARREGLLAVLPKPAPLDRLDELLTSAKRGGLVVIVEDDPALADNLTEVLRSAGLASVTASSVLETERLCVLRPFAGIVDLRVPGGADGTAMRRLSEKFPGLPMIVVTGHGDVEPPVPFQSIFRKPAPTSELLALLQDLYASREA